MFPNLRRSLPSRLMPEGYVWLTYPIRGRDEVELSLYSVGAQVKKTVPLRRVKGATDIITRDELRKTHTRVIRSRILRKTLQHNVVGGKLKDSFHTVCRETGLHHSRFIFHISY
jgi:hypothetical protein